MSFGSRLLVLWEFESQQAYQQAREAQLSGQKYDTARRRASTELATQRAQPRRRSIEIDGMLGYQASEDAREGLDAYYDDRETEEAFQRLRDRHNVTGLSESELLQLAIEASLQQTNLRNNNNSDEDVGDGVRKAIERSRHEQ